MSKYIKQKKIRNSTKRPLGPQANQKPRNSRNSNNADRTNCKNGDRQAGALETQQAQFDEKLAAVIGELNVLKNQNSGKRDILRN